MTDKEILASVDADDEEVVNTTEEVSTEEQTPAEQPAPVEQPVEPTPAPTQTNDISELDKARYSFQRQLGKAKDKYTSQINEYKKKYEALEKRLAAIENPEKPITRDQFDSDDKMIDALVQQRFDKMWSQRQEEMQAQYEKYIEEQRQEEEHKRELDEGINHWFPTKEERENFVSTVQKAYNNGLAELLEQEQNVLNYLHSTPNSSLILMEFATNPKVVNEIFSIRTPLQRLMAVHDIERDLIAKKNAPAPAPQPVEQAAPTNPAPAPVNNLSKSIGKPGTAVEAESDIFSNDDELTKFVRSI